MHERRTKEQIAVAEVAEGFLTDLENAKNWTDLLGVYHEVSGTLYNMTDGCGPQELAVCLDIIGMLFHAAISTRSGWPPRRTISEIQRLWLAETRQMIDKRLEDWEQLSSARH